MIGVLAEDEGGPAVPSPQVECDPGQDRPERLVLVGNSGSENRNFGGRPDPPEDAAEARVRSPMRGWRLYDHLVRVGVENADPLQNPTFVPMQPGGEVSTLGESVGAVLMRPLDGLRKGCPARRSLASLLPAMVVQEGGSGVSDESAAAPEIRSVGQRNRE